MMSENIINQISNLYINKTKCTNPDEIRSAIKFAIKATEKLIHSKDTENCVKVAEILFRQDFKSMYEVNEWMIKHVI